MSTLENLNFRFSFVLASVFSHEKKRCFGGEAAPAGSDVISFGATVPENALIPNQTMSMQVAESASSTVHQFPATHFHTIPASCNNVDTLQQRPQHFQQFDSSSGAPMAIGGPHLVQVANTYMASSVMAMETDMLSRDALCRSSSVSSGTSTCESSAAQSPMVMDVLMQAGAAESGRKVSCSIKISTAYILLFRSTHNCIQ